MHNAWTGSTGPEHGLCISFALPSAATVMNVLHVIPSLEAGGAQSLLARLLPALRNQGDIRPRVAVGRILGSDNERRLLNAGVEIVDLGVSLRSPRCLPALRRAIRNADIVHAHLFPAFYFVALAAAGLGKPLVFTDHSTHNRRRDLHWMRGAERLVHSRYTRLVAVSAAGRASLARWLRLPAGTERISVVGNGIDPGEWMPSVAEDPRELFGRPGRAILMAARFKKAKDHCSVVKALSLSRHKDLFVVFAGEGPTEGDVKKLALETGVADRVLFLGTRTDVARLASACSVGVQASHWEGFGLSAVEMMAAGLPVVVSDVEGLADVVADGGLKFPPGDSRELARQIDRVLDDPELRETLVAKGWERAAAFSIEETARKYRGIYLEALRSASTR